MKRLEFESALRRDVESAHSDRDTLELRDTAGMSELEKVLELHKRAARRNFIVGSRDEQAKIRERYKPANLKGVIKLKSNLPEKILPFSEVEVRMRVKESVNRLHIKEKNKSHKIFYS